MKSGLREDAHDILGAKLSKSGAKLHLSFGQSFLDLIDSHE